MTTEINKQSGSRVSSAYLRRILVKRSLIFLLAMILLAACGAKNSNTSSAGNTAGSSSAKPAVGDTVVAKYKTATFAEGKIQSIDGQKAKIGWTNKELDAADVELADVYAISKAGDPATVKAGDYALADTSSYHDGYWNKVQIVNVSGATVTVNETNDYKHDISADKVIALSQSDSAETKKMFDRNNKISDFVEKATKLRPAVPPDFKPKVGDTVVAQAPLGWDTGKIKSITGDKATILWDPKNNSIFETTFDKIIPFPSASGSVIPAVNDYVLFKSNYEYVWDYGLVTGVSGTDVEVTDRYDNKKTVKPGEFIPIK